MKIKLGKKAYEVERYKLKNWLQSEEIFYKLSKAVEQVNKDAITDNVFLYIEKAVFTEISQNLPWKDIADAFLVIRSINTPKIIPILLGSQTEKEETWEYDGRMWPTWANIFAKNYGWQLGYIANLDVDDAFGLVQEIAVQDQMEREWQWSITEVAYSYNKETQKSEFHPLPRPDWMSASMKPLEEPKKIHMPKDLLPIGNVIRPQ